MMMRKKGKMKVQSLRKKCDLVFLFARRKEETSERVPSMLEPKQSQHFHHHLP